MVEYKFGKVYKIVCNITGEIYVGSTAEKTMATRLAHHVACHKKFIKDRKTSHMSSFQILDRGNYYIELLESHPCNNKDELRKKEREWYDKIECINKVRPCISLIENKQYDANYYKENREIILNRTKLYKLKTFLLLPNPQY